MFMSWTSSKTLRSAWGDVTQQQLTIACHNTLRLLYITIYTGSQVSVVSINRPNYELSLSPALGRLLCVTNLQTCRLFFYVLLTVHISIFSLVINQLDAQNLFYNKFISCLYMFRAPCAHRQAVKIVLYSLCYHHTLISDWSQISNFGNFSYFSNFRPLTYFSVMIPEAV